MLVINYIVGIYIIIVISVILHELGHWTIAHILKLKYKKMILGSHFYILDTDHIALSIIILNGAIEMNIDELLAKKRLEVIFLFMVGPIITVILCMLSFQINHLIFRLSAIIYNGITFSLSMIPFIKGSDMNHMLSILSKID